MKTALHVKLESKCRMLRKEPRHWFPTASPVLALPEAGLGTVTLKRALYAAFVDDIPEGLEIRATCGVTNCINPYHQALTPSRSQTTKALDLRVFREEFLHGPRLPQHGTNAERIPALFAEQPTRKAGDPTPEEIVLVKQMASSSLGAIRSHTGLSNAVIIGIRTGKYDALTRGRKPRKTDVITTRGGALVGAYIKTKEIGENLGVDINTPNDTMAIPSETEVNTKVTKDPNTPMTTVEKVKMPSINFENLPEMTEEERNWLISTMSK